MAVRAYARFIAEVDLRALPLRLPPNPGIPLVRALPDAFRILLAGPEQRSLAAQPQCSDPDLFQGLVIEGACVSACHAPLCSMSTYLWPA